MGGQKRKKKTSRLWILLGFIWSVAFLYSAITCLWGCRESGLIADILFFPATIIVYSTPLVGHSFTDNLPEFLPILLIPLEVLSFFIVSFVLFKFLLR